MPWSSRKGITMNMRIDMGSSDKQWVTSMFFAGFLALPIVEEVVA